DVTIRVQNPPQCRHLHLQVTLFDDRVGPNAADDLLFGDQDALRPDQNHQEIERTAAELDRLSVDQQLASARQYAKSAKPNDRIAVHACLVRVEARRSPVEPRLRDLSQDQRLLHDPASFIGWLKVRDVAEPSDACPDGCDERLLRHSGDRCGYPKDRAARGGRAIGQMSGAVSRRMKSHYTLVEGVYDSVREGREPIGRPDQRGLGANASLGAA